MNIKKIVKYVLKNKLFINFIVNIVYCYVWIVLKTSKITININHETENVLINNTPCLCLSWHNRLLLMPELMAKFRKKNSLAGVVSRSNDGNYVSNFISKYNHLSIRGSSKNESVSALLKIIKSVENNLSIFITPDGPRGPKEKINSNLKRLIDMLNIPVIILSYEASKKFICNSWDHFIIPKPFSKIVFSLKIIDNKQITSNLDIEKLLSEQRGDIDNFI